MITKNKKQDYSNIKKYLRVVNYLTAAQLYLKDNFFLERELRHNDIKNRLLGHWGGATGVNFLLAHLNLYLKNNQKSNPKLRNIMFLLGPGHDFPALQANLFMEKTLSYFFDKNNKNIKNIFDFDITYNKEGLANMIKHFGSPTGFPTHASPDTPGAILEGGELGYSISNAYGSVLDNKDLISVVMVGDGEAETASVATAWHSSKFVNTKDNGVVLPVLNLNSYKISGPTIFGRMSDEELKTFFEGHNYEAIIVDASSDTKILANKDNYFLEKDNVHILMQNALDKAFNKIIKLKSTGSIKGLPVIILKSDKGWTGPKQFNKIKIEGNSESHQVPFENSKISDIELKELEKWLKSYKIEELFNPKLNSTENKLKKRIGEEQELFLKEIEDIIPQKLWRVGMNNNANHNGKGKLKELKLPEISNLFKDTILSNNDWNKYSPMKVVGEYMREIFYLNKGSKNFRFFSPDETYSNKLDAIFKEESRAWLLETRPWEKDLSKNGRVIEMLSENTLIGMMMGYILTGRHAFFATYEAFAQVMVSMIDQYLKFLRVSNTIPWRGDFSSFNIILTAPGWLQEHNGYSHQNPGFIDDMLARNSEEVDLYFPIDAVATGYAMEMICKSKNKINILAAGKDMDRPMFVSEKIAKRSLEEEVIIIDTFSDIKKPNESYDLIISGTGDYVSLEAIAGIDLINKLFIKYKLQKERKRFKIGFMAISKLSAADTFSEKRINFSKKLQTIIKDAKVFANFHGHPQSLMRFFFEAGYSNKDVDVRGYIERGGITTLLHMHILNETSRYHVANWILDKLFISKKIEKEVRDFLRKEIRETMEIEVKYLKSHFIDSDRILNWPN